MQSIRSHEVPNPKDQKQSELDQELDDVADDLGTTFHVVLRQLGKNYDITYPELGQMSFEFAEKKFGDRYTQKILTSGKNLRLYTQKRQDHTLKPISGERIWEVCSRYTAVSTAASLAGMDLQSFKYRLSALGKTFKELHAIKNIEDAKTALGDKFEKPFQYVAAKRRYSASLFADEGEPKELGKSKTSPGGLAP